MNELEKPGKCPVCEKTNVKVVRDILSPYIVCMECGFAIEKGGIDESISIWNRLSLSPVEPVPAVGDVFKVDGITYQTLTSSTVQVGDGTNRAISISKTSYVIPATVTCNETSYTVTSIGKWAFSWCEGLTSVTLPASLTSIGSFALVGCRGLTSICYLGTTEPTFDYEAFSCGPSDRVLFVLNATGGFTAEKWGATEVVYERAANCNHLNT